MKEIKGYEGKYAVTADGDVFSLNFGRTGKTKKMKQNISSNGYKLVRLCKNGKAKTYAVHRLLAQAFLPDYCEELHVDHIDRCRTNNKVSNLRMVTRSENQWNTNAKGYFWNKRDKKLQAQIMKDGKLFYLGCYDNEEEARNAYLSAKKELHKL